MTAAELIHPMSGLWDLLRMAGASLVVAVVWLSPHGRIVRSWWKEKKA